MIVIGVVFSVLNLTARPGLQNVLPVAVSPFCRKGDPLAEVNNPQRYRILSNCEVGRGIVKSTLVQDNGDELIYVTVDIQYVKLLGPAGKNATGTLVLELTLQDQEVFHIQSVAQHIDFVGAWVYDTQQHSNAIRPVWSLVSS